MFGRIPGITTARQGNRLAYTELRGNQPTLEFELPPVCDNFMVMGMIKTTRNANASLIGMRWGNGFFDTGLNYHWQRQNYSGIGTYDGTCSAANTGATAQTLFYVGTNVNGSSASIPSTNYSQFIMFITGNITIPSLGSPSFRCYQGLSGNTAALNQGNASYGYWGGGSLVTRVQLFDTNGDNLTDKSFVCVYGMM